MAVLGEDVDGADGMKSVIMKRKHHRAAGKSDGDRNEMALSLVCLPDDTGKSGDAGASSDYAGALSSSEADENALSSGLYLPEELELALDKCLDSNYIIIDEGDDEATLRTVIAGESSLCAKSKWCFTRII